MTECYYNEEIETIVSVYQGFLSIDEFKENAQKAIDIRAEKKCKKELVNTENLEIMLKEIQEWLNDYWFPTSEKQGLRYMAFIKPKSVFGDLSVRATNAASEMKGAIEIAYFESIEEAKEWLEYK